MASAASDTLKNHTLFRQKTRPYRRHIAARVCWTQSKERIAIGWRATSCRKRNNNMRAARNRIVEDNIADRDNVATKRQNILLMPHCSITGSSVCSYHLMQQKASKSSTYGTASSASKQLQLMIFAFAQQPRPVFVRAKLCPLGRWRWGNLLPVPRWWPAK